MHHTAEVVRQVECVGHQRVELLEIVHHGGVEVLLHDPDELVAIGSTLLVEKSGHVKHLVNDEAQGQAAVALATKNIKCHDGR